MFFPLVENDDSLNPDFGKNIAVNIFDNEEDTLGIILSPILGL